MVNQKSGTSLLPKQLNYAFPRNIAILLKRRGESIAFPCNIAMRPKTQRKIIAFPCYVAMQPKIQREIIAFQCNIAMLIENIGAVRETYPRNGMTLVFDFIYDESGRPYALNFSPNGGSYVITLYYVLNLQGDVVALMQLVEEDDGSLRYHIIANYTYNAWGELLSITDKDGNAITNANNIGVLNPIRYRGYYYDAETGFYYLQSRYYDPVTHRFINADGYASTGQGFIGTNMFAYCSNNPVVFNDDSGQFRTYSVMYADTGTHVDDNVHRITHTSTGIPVGFTGKSEDFVHSNTGLLERQLERNGINSYSRIDILYKGAFELNDEIRNRAKWETLGYNCAFIIMSMSALGIPIGASTLSGVGTQIIDGAETLQGLLDGLRPEKELSDGKYYEYSIFVDVPCSVYGEQTIKTYVLTYYVAHLYGADMPIVMYVGMD